MNIMNAITMSTTTMFMSGRGLVALRGGRKREEKKEWERLRGFSEGRKRWSRRRRRNGDTDNKPTDNGQDEYKGVRQIFAMKIEERPLWAVGNLFEINPAVALERIWKIQTESTNVKILRMKAIDPMHLIVIL